MFLEPNNENKYLFFIGYLDNIGKWQISFNYSIDYYTDYNKCFTNDENILKVLINAVLNSNDIYLKNNYNLSINNIQTIELTDINDIEINQHPNNVHLRFNITDVGSYYKIDSIYTDNRNLSTEEYLSILEVYNNFTRYESICNLINKNKYLYIEKNKLKNTFLDIYDITVVDNEMKLIFNVKDVGNAYEVVGINDSERIILGSINSTYEVFSWNIYETVCEAYLNGKVVYLPKELNSQLTINDIIITEIEDELELAKNMAKIKIKDKVYTTKLDKSSILDICQYVNLSTYFSSLGFFITEQNKDEKYIELINYISELDNEEKSNEIISKFEKYLSLSENIKLYTSHNDYICDECEKIDNCCNTDEVDSVLNDFYKEWS